LKTADKYKWQVGTAPPPLDPHSEVKHDLLREYVRRYIETLLANPRAERLTWTLVDGFAGGGAYTGAKGQVVKGSPLLLIEGCRETEAAIQSVRTKPVSLDTHYRFVEKDPGAVAYLNAELDVQGCRAALGDRLRVVQGTFEQHCDDIVSDIKARGRSERALFVLDQYGFTDVPIPLIRSIFERLDKPEVILTFGIDSLLTYLSDNPTSRATLQRLGLDRYVDWPNLSRMKEAGRFKELVQRQLSLGLLEQSGALFITLFFVRPLGSTPWDYWLVHLSRSYRARDVMMQVHWSLGNQFTHAMEPGLFQLGYAPAADSLASGQYDLPLGAAYTFDQVLRDAARKELELVLPRQVYGQTEPIRFVDLAARVANQTAVTEDVLKEALGPGIECRELVVLGPNGERRTKGSSIRSQDLISPSPQRPLFLPVQPSGLTDDD
jgi:three-Cys-motif partner protein